MLHILTYEASEAPEGEVRVRQVLFETSFISFLPLPEPIESIRIHRTKIVPNDFRAPSD